MILSLNSDVVVICLDRSSEPESAKEKENEPCKKKKRTHNKEPIPKPFGTAGKQGDGERGDKGYCLIEKMGLEDDKSLYLRIRVSIIFPFYFI